MTVEQTPWMHLLLQLRSEAMLSKQFLIKLY